MPSAARHLTELLARPSEPVKPPSSTGLPVIQGEERQNSLPPPPPPEARAAAVAASSAPEAPAECPVTPTSKRADNSDDDNDGCTTWSTWKLPVFVRCGDDALVVHHMAWTPRATLGELAGFLEAVLPHCTTDAARAQASQVPLVCAFVWPDGAESVPHTPRRGSPCDDPYGQRHATVAAHADGETPPTPLQGPRTDEPEHVAGTSPRPRNPKDEAVRGAPCPPRSCDTSTSRSGGACGCPTESLSQSGGVTGSAASELPSSPLPRGWCVLCPGRSGACKATQRLRCVDAGVFPGVRLWITVSQQPPPHDPPGPAHPVPLAPKDEEKEAADRPRSGRPDHRRRPPTVDPAPASPPRQRGSSVPVPSSPHSSPVPPADGSGATGVGTAAPAGGSRGSRRSRGDGANRKRAARSRKGKPSEPASSQVAADPAASHQPTKKNQQVALRWFNRSFVKPVLDDWQRRGGGVFQSADSEPAENMPPLPQAHEQRSPVPPSEEGIVCGLTKKEHGGRGGREVGASNAGESNDNIDDTNINGNNIYNDDDNDSDDDDASSRSRGGGGGGNDDIDDDDRRSHDNEPVFRWESVAVTLREKVAEPKEKISYLDALMAKRAQQPRHHPTPGAAARRVSAFRVAKPAATPAEPIRRDARGTVIPPLHDGADGRAARGSGPHAPHRGGGKGQPAAETEGRAAAGPGKAAATPGGSGGDRSRRSCGGASCASTVDPVAVPASRDGRQPPAPEHEVVVAAAATQLPRGRGRKRVRSKGAGHHERPCTPLPKQRLVEHTDAEAVAPPRDRRRDGLRGGTRGTSRGTQTPLIRWELSAAAGHCHAASPTAARSSSSSSRSRSSSGRRRRRRWSSGTPPLSPRASGCADRRGYAGYALIKMSHPEPPSEPLLLAAPPDELRAPTDRRPQSLGAALAPSPGAGKLVVGDHSLPPGTSAAAAASALSYRLAQEWLWMASVFQSMRWVLPPLAPGGTWPDHGGHDDGRGWVPRPAADGAAAMEATSGEDPLACGPVEGATGPGPSLLQ